MSTYSDYDAFASVYNKYMGNRFSAKALYAFEQLVTPRVPKDAHILDLCCGTGQKTQILAERGYSVTGLDGSREMLKFAGQNAPGVTLVLDDARTFRLPAEYDVVVSMFDSLNHVMTIQELTAVFRNVHSCLKHGGKFLFDMNMEAFLTSQGYSCVVEDDCVYILAHSSDAEKRIVTFAITIFRLEDNSWRRSDFKLTQKCYSEEELRSSLESVGFEEINAYAGDPQTGLVELTKDSSRGFFLCEV